MGNTALISTVIPTAELAGVTGGLIGVEVLILVLWTAISSTRFEAALHMKVQVYFSYAALVGVYMCMCECAYVASKFSFLVLWTAISSTRFEAALHMKVDEHGVRRYACVFVLVRACVRVRVNVPVWSLFVRGVMSASMIVLSSSNIPPLNRGTAALPILCLSHEKDTTHLPPLK